MDFFYYFLWTCYNSQSINYNTYFIIFSIIINNLQIIRYSPYLYRRYIIFAVNQKKSSL